MEQTVDDLISQFNRGSSLGYTSIYNLCAPSIYYFAKKFVQNREVAEDITADAFIKLYRLRANFNTLTNIKAFLHITVRNACLNYLRDMKWREQKKRELLYMLTSADEVDRFPEEEYRAELLQRLYEEIEKLPKKCKQVFKLAYLEGLKNEEIARLLKINTQSVKNQKARALKVLRLALCGKYALAILLTRIYKIF